MPSLTTALSLDAPNLGNPNEYPLKSYMTFLMLTVWAYLRSNLCGCLNKIHIQCNKMRVGRSRSSKVIDLDAN